jgi:multicomponent Na+:H+ antiporter subunit B
MLSGIYSLLSASLFVVLDAVDVAFTEAAVGAGISTVLMLGTLALTGRSERRPRHTALLPIVVVVLTGSALVYGTLDMPRYGDPNAPIHRHVAPHYLEDSEAEIGVPNVVTSVLASYRGYDTLGEVTVIFTAGIGVLALLSSGLRRGEKHAMGIQHHLVLHVVTKLLVPLILLFALYVQFHGDYGPGGGFQAGVIFGSAFILYALVFGLDHAREVAPPSVLQMLMATGVLVYAGVGVNSLLLGGSFLQYGVLAEDPVHGQHLGIMLIELGVGITVAGAMIAIFFMFTGRRP